MEKKEEDFIIYARPAKKPIILNETTPTSNYDEKTSSTSAIELQEYETKTTNTNITNDYETATSSSIAYASVPLILYKRNNPRIRQIDAPNETFAENLTATQIVLPNNQVCLGFPPQKDKTSGNQNAIDEDKLVVFSPPGPDQENHLLVYMVMVLFLLFSDFIFVILIFVHGPGSIRGSEANGEHDFEGTIGLMCTLSVIALGIVGTAFVDARLLNLFIIVFYIDGMFNLLRVYTILQFGHFVLQLIICYLCKEMKSLLTPIWFSAKYR